MLPEIYNQTITILNKLKRTDGVTGVDVWYKTVVNDAAWYKKSERGVSASNAIIGAYVKILIPFHEEYLPYMEWKKPGNQDGHFTISGGDYIVLGTVEEEITAANIVKTMNDYGENVCQVKAHADKYSRFGASVQLDIEGV